MGQSLEAASSNLPLCDPRHPVRSLPSAVVCEGLPQWLRGEEFVCSAGVAKDAASVPGSERPPGEGCGNPLQCSSLENPQYSSRKSPTDRGAWQATAHEAAKSWTWLKWLSTHVRCMWKFPSSPSRAPFWQRFSQEVSRNLHPGVLSPWRRIPHAACAPCCAQVLRRVRLSETPRTVARQPRLSMGFCRREHWRGCLSLLQGIYLSQESNQELLHCRGILYQLSYQGSPTLCLLVFKVILHKNCMSHSNNPSSLLLVTNPNYVAHQA